MNYRLGSLAHNTCRQVIRSLAVISVVCALLAVAWAQGEDRSDEAIALFNSGQDAHEKGDLQTAIQNYEKAIKLVTDFPEAEVQLGNAYVSLGRLDDAERAFRRAVAQRDDWSLALANLGGVLVRKGKFREAEPLLAKAIELDEQNFPAYTAMTELRLQTKADPKVLNLLLARLTLITSKANPTAAVWASRAALEIATGDLKTARVSSARALELDPRSQFALATSADLALLENDPTSADALVRRLETIAPQTEQVKVLRARLLVAQAKSTEALDLLASIASPAQSTIDVKNQIVAMTATNPSDIEKQLTIDPTRALEHCRRASEAAPTNVEPVIGYAAALVQAKRYEEAVTVLRRVLAIAPSNSTVHANLGTALFQLKRFAEAKTEFRWLAENRPDHPTAYYFLGIVHDQLNEFADAAANYQQFLRLADPESSKLEIEKVNLRLPILNNLLKEGKGKKRG
jgi:Flp pilus assembly protein TadD